MPQFLGLVIALAVLAIIVTVAGKLLGGKSPGAKIPPPFRKRKSVLTENERAFFHTLCRAVPEGHFVFANMRLIDLMEIEGNGPAVEAWRNKVWQKHVDFVICEPAQLSPLMVIEVDGKIHSSARQAQRDADKDVCLRAAKIPLLRLPAKSTGRALADLCQRVEAVIRPAAEGAARRWCVEKQGGDIPRKDAFAWSVSPGHRASHSSFAKKRAEGKRRLQSRSGPRRAVEGCIGHDRGRSELAGPLLPGSGLQRTGRTAGGAARAGRLF